MRWSDLKTAPLSAFHGSPVASNVPLSIALGMRSRGDLMLEGCGAEEDHGPWEQHQDPDVLILGCSVTASQNLPRKFSWPGLMRSLTDQRINLTARTASSTIRQLAMASEHQRRYGPARQILALLPNLDRAWLPFLQRTETEARLNFLDALWAPRENRYFLTEEILGRLSSSTVRNTGRTDPALIVSLSHQLLDLWHEISAIRGTDLRISSWHEQTNDVLQALYPSHRMPAYRPDPSADWRIDGRFGSSEETVCGHHPHNDLQQRFWHRADDQIHPGLHHHIHIYETITGNTVRSEDLARL